MPAEQLPDPTLYDFLREEFEREIRTHSMWPSTAVLIEFDKAAIRAMQRYAALKGISLE